MNDRLEKQLRFALEADKEKNIVRQTLISDGSRRENDAEHAWHAALMAVLLHEHSNEKIDLLRTVTMLLIRTTPATPTPTTNRRNSASATARPQPPTGSSVCSPTTSAIPCGRSGRNLKQARPPKPNSPGRWTISSP